MVLHGKELASKAVVFLGPSWGSWRMASEHRDPALHVLCDYPAIL